jgi:hypothetical protein
MNNWIIEHTDFGWRVGPGFHTTKRYPTQPCSWSLASTQPLPLMAFWRSLSIIFPTCFIPLLKCIFGGEFSAYRHANCVLQTTVFVFFFYLALGWISLTGNSSMVLIFFIRSPPPQFSHIPHTQTGQTRAYCCLSASLIDWHHDFYPGSPFFDLPSLDYFGIHEHIILILKSCRSQHYILHISIMRAGLLISLSHMPWDSVLLLIWLSRQLYFALSESLYRATLGTGISWI